jgi:restriction endonuclease S subunit
MAQVKSLQTGIKFKDTPIGKIPVDWEVTSLEKIAFLEYGSSLPEKKRLEGPIPVYGSNGIVGYHNEKLLKGPGIIIGRKGTVGAVTWSDNDFWPIDTTYFISKAQMVLLPSLQSPLRKIKCRNRHPWNKQECSSLVNYSSSPSSRTEKDR